MSDSAVEAHKTLVLKMSHTQGDMTLFHQSFYKTMKTSIALFNEIVCWGNEEVFSPQKRGEKIKLNEHLDALYEQYIHKHIIPTKEQFYLIMKILYHSFIAESHSRGFASIILGNQREKDILSDEDWRHLKNINDVKLNSSHILCKKIGNTLVASGFRNRNPYNLYYYPHERYIIIENVHRWLKSWYECNKRNAHLYQEEDIQIEKMLSGINVDVINDIRQFCNDLIKDHIIGSKKFQNAKFKSYLKDCIIPCLNANKVPTEHFYIDKQGNKRSYSLHPNFIHHLLKYPSLWQNSKNPVLIEHIDTIGMCYRHSQVIPGAAYPFINDENDGRRRFQYFLGDNYFNKYHISTNGTYELESPLNNEHILKGSVAHHLFVNLSFSDGTVQFRIHTRDMRSTHNPEIKKQNPSQYFKHLRIWGMKNSCNYVLQYQRKNDTMLAYLKEPAILLDENGNFQMRLNHTIIVPDEHKNAIDMNKKIAKFFNTAPPIKVSDRSVLSEHKANKQIFEEIQGSTVRILGVDLGIKNTVACVVAETTITDPINNFNNIRFIGDPIYLKQTPDIRTTYHTMINEYELFFHLVNIFKEYKKHPDVAIEHLKKQKQVQNFFQKVFLHFKNQKYTSFGLKKKTYLQSLLQYHDSTLYLEDQLKKNGNNIEYLKNHLQSPLRLALKYLEYKFFEEKNRRKYYFKFHSPSQPFDKFHNDFQWITLIDLYKSAKKKMHYFGNDSTPNQQRNELDLTLINTYFNNCKDNFIKSVSSFIVKTAKEHNCNIIVLERLNNEKGKKNGLNTRKDNYKLSMWAIQRLQEAIKNAASFYGILICTVDECLTSQVHFESQTFGYRDGETLYYLENDKVASVNADINASKNICLKFFSRHLVTSKLYKECGKENDQNSHKRNKASMTYYFGSVKKANEFFDTYFSNEKVIFRNGTKWVTETERKNLQESIKNMLLNQH